MVVPLMAAAGGGPSGSIDWDVVDVVCQGYQVGVLLGHHMHDFTHDLRVSDICPILILTSQKLDYWASRSCPQRRPRPRRRRC